MLTVSRTMFKICVKIIITMVYRQVLQIKKASPVNEFLFTEKSDKPNLNSNCFILRRTN